MNGPLHIGLVAGEASGDLLGGALIDALRKLAAGYPASSAWRANRMRAAGCEPLGSSEEIAVMGFVEPLRHLPRLLRLRARLEREFLERKVDVFVGIDSPAFNLGLAGSLHRSGMTTVQYVSPQVWAWRPGRVRKIAAAVDAVLCLLPFEPKFYAGTFGARGIRRPSAGRPDTAGAGSHRRAPRPRAVPEDARVVAVLPGSREAEVQRLGADFASGRCTAGGQFRAGLLHFLRPWRLGRLAAMFARQVRDAGATVRLVDRVRRYRAGRG